MNQSDLWGNQIPKATSVVVFHDESESMPDKRWLLIGCLFVRKSNVQTVLNALQHCRRKESYTGEVHFSQLSGSFKGKYSGKERLARDWIGLYQGRLHSYAHLTVLSIDRQSPAFHRDRFKHDYHAYNRFTAMAIKSGIAWHFGPQQFEEIQLHVVSDAKDRRTSIDGSGGDNFEHYLEYRTEFDSFLSREIDHKKYPDLRLTKVETVSSRENDAIQLTDLLVGSAKQAIAGGSQSSTKTFFGRVLGSWCLDLRLKPWEQRFKLHRMVNISIFPDKHGRVSDDFRLACIFNEADDLFSTK